MVYLCRSTRRVFLVFDLIPILGSMYTHQKRSGGFDTIERLLMGGARSSTNTTPFRHVCIPAEEKRWFRSQRSGGFDLIRRLLMGGALSSTSTTPFCHVYPPKKKRCSFDPIKRLLTEGARSSTSITPFLSCIPTKEKRWFRSNQAPIDGKSMRKYEHHTIL